MDNLPQKISTLPSASPLQRLTPSTIGNVTLSQAAGPEAYPIRRLIRERGELYAVTWIEDVLT